VAYFAAKRRRFPLEAQRIGFVLQSLVGLDGDRARGGSFDVANAAAIRRMLEYWHPFGAFRGSVDGSPSGVLNPLLTCLGGWDCLYVGQHEAAIRAAAGYAQALAKVLPADSKLSRGQLDALWSYHVGDKGGKGYPETEQSGQFWRAMIDMPIRLPAARGIPASGPAAAGLPRARSVLWYCPESNLSSEHWAGGNAF
jgi:hypothetical protein